MTPDEVLLVLNAMEPLDISQWEFAVVTEGAMEVAGQGRLAGQLVRLSEPNFYPFRQGEILVLAEDGREPLGEARKPGKWDVRVEYFDNLDAAKACREAVLAGKWARCTCDYGTVAPGVVEPPTTDPDCPEHGGVAE